jgi:hypothetical protein
MTETRSTIEKTVRVGVIRNLEPREMDGLEIMVGTLTSTVKGETRVETISVSGDALTAVGKLLVEGAQVALYGAVHADYFKVLGPDLRKKTLARQGKVQEVRQPSPQSQEAARRRAIFFARRRAAQAA